MVEVGAERVDQDRGFVAIIEEGDALAEISTYHAGSLSKYNAINMLFTPRPKDSYNLQNAISVAANATWTVVSSRKYTGNYTIRYIMLTDEDTAKEKGITEYYDTTWVGMATAYRDYLYAKGELDSLTKEDVKEDIPVYIQTFGALETLEKFLSIPITVMAPLTSFDDIKTMHSELSAEGVSNIKFKLTGYANGGLDAKYPEKVKWLSAVGGKKGFADLQKFASEKGFGVYPEFDFSYASYESGVSLKKHASRAVDDRYCSKQLYDPVYQQFESYFDICISPSSIADLVAEFSKSYSKFEPTGISVSTSSSPTA